MSTTTLAQVAQALEAEWIGNPDLDLRGVAHPLQAQSENELALLFDKKVFALLENKPLQTALVPAEAPELPIPNQIRVKRPRLALAKLLEIFDRPVYVAPGIHPSAVIDPTAVIEAGVAIGPLCVVGPGARIGKGSRLVAQVFVGAHAEVGEDCLFHPGACVGDRVKIGHRVILQPNAAIGSDGFSFVTEEAGSVESARATGEIQAQNSRILRINSIGTVVLEDDVEIGANACIDRATLGETRIKRSTKLDNLIQIAHNVTIGENCLFAAQVGVAGSTKVGNRTVIGGQAGLPDHIQVGEDCIIMSQSGVTADVPDKSLLVGSPAVPRKEFLQKEMFAKRAKSMSQKIKELEQRLEALESQTQSLEPVGS